MSRPKSTIKYRPTAEFGQAIKKYSNTHGIPLWKMAANLGVHPSILSRVINMRPVWVPEVERIKSVATDIGFTGECFEKYSPKKSKTAEV